MKLSQYLTQIKPLDTAAMTLAQQRWDAIAKPLHSLGLLEDAVVNMAGIMGTAQVDIAKRAVVVMCADNGVVAQGVSQTDQSVTAIVTENMTRGVTSVCQMAKLAGAKVVAVDIGCATPVHGDGLVQAAIRRGTADMTQAPAMTREEAEQAILVGIDMVKQLKDQGYQLIATGEMGIGNTTTASAVLSVLLHQSPETMTGRGAGLSSAGLERKKVAIAKAIALHQPDPCDVVEVLSTVGGLDIAGLCGVFLGGAIYRVPVLIDGVISATAALCAKGLCETCVGYMLPSHQSAEPAGGLVLQALGLEAMLHGRMALGEGTGAVAVMPLLDMALAVYSQMDDFDGIGVEAYTPQE